jgi:hypothetical protein
MPVAAGPGIALTNRMNAPFPQVSREYLDFPIAPTA